MEVGHDDEAEDGGDDADEFDFVVALNAAGEVVGDEAVEFDYQNASRRDGDASEEPP